MNSINKNQVEDNHEDLIGEEAIEKIKELIKKAGTCFFCTGMSSKSDFFTRPMSVLKTDDEGNIWFMSANDSNKNAQLESDPFVKLLFQGSSYADFLSITGEGTITQDKAIIKELWNPMLKTWFTEGEDDPRISVIKITPQEGYYWDTKHNMAIGFVKRIVGAVIGKTMDDSIEGRIEV